MKQGNHKKNVEACEKKVVVEAEYLLLVLPKSLNVEGFFIYFVERCCWACWSLDGVWEIRGSHFMFQYERIR